MNSVYCLDFREPPLSSVVLYFKCSDVWKTNIGSRWDSWSGCQARTDGCEVMFALYFGCAGLLLWKKHESCSWWKFHGSRIGRRSTTPLSLFFFFVFFLYSGRFQGHLRSSTVTLQYNKLSSIQVVFKAIRTVMNWTDISLAITILQITFIHVWWIIYFLHYWKRARCHIQSWGFAWAVALEKTM